VSTLLPAEALAHSVAKAQLGRGENPPPNTTAALAVTIDRLTGNMCCDLHGRNCEPPGDLCCEDCTEARHAGWTDERRVRRYGHPAGEVCANPDLSDLPVQAGGRP
jgi:hypothetical protein